MVGVGGKSWTELVSNQFKAEARSSLWPPLFMDIFTLGDRLKITWLSYMTHANEKYLSGLFSMASPLNSYTSRLSKKERWGGGKCPKASATSRGFPSESCQRTNGKPASATQVGTQRTLTEASWHKSVLTRCRVGLCNTGHPG